MLHVRDMHTCDDPTGIEFVFHPRVGIQYCILQLCRVITVSALMVAILSAGVYVCPAYWCDFYTNIKDYENEAHYDTCSFNHNPYTSL